MTEEFDHDRRARTKGGALDEVSPGEITRRLDRLDGRLDGFENLLRETSLRVVSQDAFNQYRQDADRRFAEVDRDLGQEVSDRKAGDQDLRAGQEKQGSNWRQAIYAGLIPSALFLVGILLQLKGSG